MKHNQTKSAGGVVVNRYGKILLVNQKGTSWSLSKGHIENKESPLQASIREIEEETGITQLKFIKKLGRYKRYKMGVDNKDDLSELKNIVMFLFTTEQIKLNPQDKENPEAIWVDKDKVIELLTHRKDKEFFLSIIDKI